MSPRLTPSQRAELRKLVTKHHNEKLIEEHQVFHIWNDGRITQTKGGHLYGGRTLFKIHVPLTEKNMFGRFPCKDKSFNNDQTASFAIVPEEVALEIRNEMKQILKISDDVPKDFVKDWFYDQHQITSEEYCSGKCLEDIIKLRK
jgi:hypothetical protein